MFIARTRGRVIEKAIHISDIGEAVDASRVCVGIDRGRGGGCWFIRMRGIMLPNDGSQVTFAESAPAGIADPSTVSDEENNIEVYKTISPGVAYINTTSVQQDFWGGTQEGKGTGSGSVIDNNGDILTNYHVIEGATKLTVSFGGDKTYTATVVGGDPDTDLAVIKIASPPAGLPGCAAGRFGQAGRRRRKSWRSGIRSVWTARSRRV